MHELVIEIGGEGTVKAMHSDAFDLGFLGRKEVRRQTEIKFNADSQKWDIHYLKEDGTEVRHDNLDGFDGYEEARNYEVLWVNLCRFHSIEADGEEGLTFIGWLRWADHRQCFPLANGGCASTGCRHAVAIA